MVFVTEIVEMVFTIADKKILSLERVKLAHLPST
jgi:hypothetical protein